MTWPQRDGKGLTELEFVVTMLMELEIVDGEVMKPFIKQFRSLDIDGEGRVGLQDLRLIKQMTDAELSELRAKRASSGKRFSVVAVPDADTESQPGSPAVAMSPVKLSTPQNLPSPPKPKPKSQFDA